MTAFKIFTILILTEERLALKTQHKRECDGRVRDRIKAVLLHDKGWTAPKIAEVLLIDEKTIWDFFEITWPNITPSMTDRINDSFKIINPASSI